MTLDVYRGSKTTIQQQSLETSSLIFSEKWKQYLWMSSAAVVIGALRIKYLAIDATTNYKLHLLQDVVEIIIIALECSGYRCQCV